MTIGPRHYVLPSEDLCDVMALRAFIALSLPLPLAMLVKLKPLSRRP